MQKEKLQQTLQVVLESGDTDIYRGFQWIDAVVRNKQASELESLLENNQETLFHQVFYCYLLICKFDLVKGSVVLAKIHQNQNAKKYLPFLVGEFSSIIHQYQNAANQYLAALNADKNCLFLWRKLLNIALQAGWYSQGVRWYEQAMGGQIPWNNEAKIILMDFGSIFYVNSYSFLKAIELCRNHISLLLDRPLLQKNIVVEFDTVSAWLTVTTILDLLESHGLKPFPTSGTLLGWQREGNLLSFDKDIDIALHPNDDIIFASRILSMQPRFKIINDMDYSSWRGIKDLETGIEGDMLSFSRVDKKFHYGWMLPAPYTAESRILEFSPFELIQEEWKGRKVWRPDNTDLFLTEMYGDWKTPYANFDSTVGCKNLVTFSPLAQVYGYKNIIAALAKGKLEKALISSRALRDKGDNHTILNDLEATITQMQASHTLNDKKNAA